MLERISTWNKFWHTHFPWSASLIKQQCWCSMVFSSGHASHLHCLFYFIHHTFLVVLSLDLWAWVCRCRCATYVQSTEAWLCPYLWRWCGHCCCGCWRFCWCCCCFCRWLREDLKLAPHILMSRHIAPRILGERYFVPLAHWSIVLLWMILGIYLTAEHWPSRLKERYWDARLFRWALWITDCRTPMGIRHMRINWTTWGTSRGCDTPQKQEQNWNNAWQRDHTMLTHFNAVEEPSTVAEIQVR